VVLKLIVHWLIMTTLGRLILHVGLLVAGLGYFPDEGKTLGWLVPLLHNKVLGIPYLGSLILMGSMFLAGLVLALMPRERRFRRLYVLYWLLAVFGWSMARMAVEVFGGIAGLVIWFIVCAILWILSELRILDELN